MKKIIHLESRINQIYDHLYANAPVRTPAAIGKEVGKVMRAIAYVEKKKPSSLSAFWRLHKNGFTKEDTELIKETSNLIRESFKEVNEKFRYFGGDDEIELNDSDIGFVCGRLEGINVSTSQRDVFGDSMEVFRSHWKKSSGGQFFTDQRVTQLAVRLLNYHPQKDDFVDICAGTGGFLIAAIREIKRISQGDEEKSRAIARRSILGQEIDKELAAIANSTIRSQLGLSSDDFVNAGDSIQQSSFSSKGKIKFNSHDCLATNPPFGTKTTVKDSDVLRWYDLAKTHTRAGLFGEASRITQRAPDILFIEQNIKLLKPGQGRLAIVVPYQIVSGPQTLFVRQWILRNAQILAVIDLPPETFQPHTGTKASLMVLKRRRKPLEQIDLTDDGNIFMSTPKWIGHDRRGNTIYKKAPDGSMTDEVLTDFPDVEKDYERYLSKGEMDDFDAESFVIDSKVIAHEPLNRLDARYYRPHKTDNVVSRVFQERGKEWRIVKLRDVVDKIFCPGRFARNYVQHDADSVPFLGGADITQLLLKTEKRIGTNDSRLSELEVRAGWLLITRSGSVGIVSSVPVSWEGYAVSEHVIRIVPDAEKLAPEYLFAFLKTKFAQDMIARGVYGSVIDEITPEYIGNLQVPIPRNESKLNRIIDYVKQGEKARQHAISNLGKGIDYLGSILTG